MSTTVGRKRKLKERDEPAGAQAEEQVAEPTASHPVEETVKSHAALRKERKRALKQTSTNLPPKLDKAKKEKTAREPPPTRQNSVWVGNLAYKTTPEDLKKFFDGVGDITRVHMPTKTVGTGSGKFGVRGDNMGFAYVDFATSDAKTIAITLSENNLDGRKLLIKDGGDFTGRPSAAHNPGTNASNGVDQADGTTVSQPSHSKFAQKVLKSQKQPPAPTLFMGNLPFEINVEDIKSMLEAHRSLKKPSAANPSNDNSVVATPWLKKIRLGTFEDSGKCKGWAFLDFVGISEATDALTNPRNHKMNGRDLVLEYASPDAVRRGGQLAKDAERPRKRARTTQKSDATAEVEENDDLKAQERPPPRSTREQKPRQSLGKDGKPRPRPGAALAMAKRQNVAIVESQGQKIKF